MTLEGLNFVEYNSTKKIMKKLLTFLLLLLFIAPSAISQRNKQSNEAAISGEYSGVFTDIKNGKGAIDLFLYQANQGFTEGIVVMKMDSNPNKAITGIIHLQGNGQYISGSFNPSVIHHFGMEANGEKMVAKSSYECGWSFYGEMKTPEKIVGKAVPLNCNESNLFDFTVTRKKK